MDCMVTLEYGANFGHKHKYPVFCAWQIRWVRISQVIKHAKRWTMNQVKSVDKTYLSSQCKTLLYDAIMFRWILMINVALCNYAFSRVSLTALLQPAQLAACTVTWRNLPNWSDWPHCIRHRVELKTDFCVHLYVQYIILTC